MLALWDYENSQLSRLSHLVSHHWVLPRAGFAAALVKEKTHRQTGYTGMFGALTTAAIGTTLLSRGQGLWFHTQAQAEGQPCGAVVPTASPVLPPRLQVAGEG